jgi:hypothetical protein
MHFFVFILHANTNTNGAATLGTRLTFLYIFPYFVDYPNDHLLQYENVFDGFMWYDAMQYRNI